MRRDMNLVKQILLNIEKNLKEENLDSYMEQDILNHKGLLIENGFINGVIHHNSESFERVIDGVIINNLTWQGYDLIDILKDESKFEMIKNLGKNISSEVLKIALTNVINS